MIKFRLEFLIPWRIQQIKPPKKPQLPIPALFEIAKTEFSQFIDLERADFRLEEVEYKIRISEYHVVVSYLVQEANAALDIEDADNKTENKYTRVYKKLITSLSKKVIGIYIFEKKLDE
jgi:hypothetical protein